VPHRPRRPFLSLAIVALLAFCDYLLWNWSLGVNHDILALVSGMTLIPLLIALAWLLVLALAHLLARIAQRPWARSALGPARPVAGSPPALGDPAGLDGRGAGGSSGAPTASPSSKIAA
jgi:hypothetical protein